MKKIYLIIIALFIALILGRLSPASAAETCNEFYYLSKESPNLTIRKISTNNPSKSYNIASFPFDSYPPNNIDLLPNLTRFNNGQFAIFYSIGGAALRYKNISTGGKVTIIDSKLVGEVRWYLLWPRAVQLQTGEIIVVTFAGYKNEEDCRHTRGCVQDTHIRLVSSNDNGETWQFLSEFDKSITGDPNRGGFFHPSIIQLNNGWIGLAVVEQLNFTEAQCNWLRTDTVSFYLSKDKGKTWERRANIFTGPCKSEANEPSILQEPDGKLVAVFSYGSAVTKEGNIKQSISQDNGLTWSTPIIIADTFRKSFNVVPILKRVGDKYVLTYNQIIMNNETVTDRVFTLKIADGLNKSSWDVGTVYHPTSVGTGTVGSACQPPPSPSPTHNPADLTDEGDTPGDEVNIYDYNLLVTDFGKTGSPGWIKADIDNNGKVDIFDYNILVSNYDQ